MKIVGQTEEIAQKRKCERNHRMFLDRACEEELSVNQLTKYYKYFTKVQENDNKIHQKIRQRLTRNIKGVQNMK